MRRFIPLLALAPLTACGWLTPDEPAPSPTPMHAEAILEAVPPSTAEGTVHLDGTTAALVVDAHVRDVPEGTYALHLLPPGRCEAIDLDEAVPLLHPERDARITPAWTVLPDEAFFEGAWLTGTVRIEARGESEDLEAWRLVVTRDNGVPSPQPVACGRIEPVRVPGA